MRQIARTYASEDDGGRHDRPYRRFEYPAGVKEGAIVRTSRISGNPVAGIRLCPPDRAPRPRGCPGQRPRPRPRPKAVEHAPQDHDAGDDRRRPVGVQSGDLAALVERQRREPVAQRRERRARQHVALDPRGVVGLEREVDRRARGRGAGDGDRRPALARTSAGTAASMPRATSAASASSSRGRRRVVVQMALACGGRRRPASRRGSPARARRRRRARSSRRRCRSRAAGRRRPRGRAAVAPRERERRLLVAGEVAPVEPEALAHRSRGTRRRSRRRAPPRSSPRRSPRSPASAISAA